MKRLLPTAIAALVFLPGGAYGQFIWSGGGADGSVARPENWDNDGVTPTGNGTEDFVFGSFAGPQVNVTLPDPIAVNNVTFNGTGPLNLTFSATNNESAVFRINGTVDVGEDYSLLFENTVSLLLGSGARSVVIGANATVAVDGSVGGLDATSQLVKDGSGTLILNAANTFAGGTIVRGGRLILDGTNLGSILHNTKPLDVGYDIATPAQLDLLDGAEIENAIGTIGRLADTIGVVTVSGGSTWTNNGYLYIGDAGHGTLEVNSGGAVFSTNVSLGNNRNNPDVGIGVLTVDGLGSAFTVADTLYVGSQGEGWVYVNNGALMSSMTGVLGNNAGGYGRVVVDGFAATLPVTPSTWSNSGVLTIGAVDHGELVISGGGLVTGTEGWIASGLGSVGEVTVTGTNSTWDLSSFLVAGGAGTAFLDILAGGHVENQAAYVGKLSGGDGYVTVSGAGSTWLTNGILTIGGEGSGGLSIEAGGSVHNIGDARIADTLDTTGFVYVDGSGSEWNADGILQVGVKGSGTVSVSNGATITSGPAILGVDAGSFGAVYIESGGSWSADTSLVVGSYAVALLALDVGGVEVAAGEGTILLGQHMGSEGTLYLNSVGAVVNASAITTGDGVGTLQFGTSAPLGSPFRLTNTGDHLGDEVGLTGNLRVYHTSGHTELTRDNTYGGGTYVFGGTLTVDAATVGAQPLGLGNVEVFGGTLEAAGTGTVIDNFVQVDTTGRVAGTGTFVEATVSHGGAVAPGFSLPPDRIGELTFEDLTLGPDSVLDVDVAFDGSWSADVILVTGPLAITATALDPVILRFWSLDGTGSNGPLQMPLELSSTYHVTFLQTWSLGDSLELGTNLMVDMSNFDTGFDSYLFDLSVSEGTFTLSFTPVPEPSTYALLGVGLLTLLARRRGKRL